MSIRTFALASSLVTLIACDAPAEAPAPVEAAAEPELSLLDYEDPTVRAFLVDALAGRLPDDASITYEVRVVDEDGVEGWIPVTLGVSDEVGGDDGDAIALMSDYALHWCETVGPTVSKTVWATSCSKSTARDTAQSWAVSLADDQCEATLSLAGGDAACRPDLFDDNICVSGGGSFTSVCQHGSDTACGGWPFRHAEWKATYAYTGDCGYNCYSNL